MQDTYSFGHLSADSFDFLSLLARFQPIGKVCPSNDIQFCPPIGMLLSLLTSDRIGHPLIRFPLKLVLVESVPIELGEFLDGYSDVFVRPIVTDLAIVILLRFVWSVSFLTYATIGT